MQLSRLLTVNKISFIAHRAFQDNDMRVVYGCISNCEKIEMCNLKVQNIVTMGMECDTS